MVDLSAHGKDVKELIWEKVNSRLNEVATKIDNRTGEGSDFLGWTNYASNMSGKLIKDIEETAKEIRSNFDCLVVIGIGGSYLGARAIIEARNGLYPNDDFEIYFLGQTMSTNYTKQVLNKLENKNFAINVISKSGTTLEPSLAFRLCKELLIKKYGKEYLKKAVFATTDANRGLLKKEADNYGYKTFVIPDDIGGRFSVITPVGLLPIACANISIKDFIKGVISGEKEYSVVDIEKNPAYKYGALRYLLHTQKNFTSEMYITYEPQYKMIIEWLKQLFDESEGKDNKALLCSSAVFSTDLHSLGQFIQEGSPCLFETILWVDESNEKLNIPYVEDDEDQLNFVANKSLNYINTQAYKATLEAHTQGHTPALVLNIKHLDAYNLGNLVYFFFRACAFSAYLLDVNPFNQPGVEVYKKKMFTLLGK